MFKKVCLLNLFIFLVTRNAVLHLRVVNQYPWVKYRTDCVQSASDIMIMT